MIKYNRSPAGNLESVIEVVAAFNTGVRTYTYLQMYVVFVQLYRRSLAASSRFGFSLDQTLFGNKMMCGIRVDGNQMEHDQAQIDFDVLEPHRR